MKLYLIEGEVNTDAYVYVCKEWKLSWMSFSCKQRNKLSMAKGVVKVGWGLKRGDLRLRARKLECKQRAQIV